MSPVARTVIDAPRLAQWEEKMHFLKQLPEEGSQYLDSDPLP